MNLLLDWAGYIHPHRALGRVDGNELEHHSCENPGLSV